MKKKHLVLFQLKHHLLESKLLPINKSKIFYYLTHTWEVTKFNQVFTNFFFILFYRATITINNITKFCLGTIFTNFINLFLTKYLNKI